MEAENIGIPVILQGLDLLGEKARKNSIPQEAESNGGDVGSDIRRDSITEIPPEMDPKGGDVRGNSDPGVSQDIEPNGGDSRRSSIPVIPQEMDPKGGDVGGNPVMGIPQDIEPNRGDIRRSSIGNLDPPSTERNSIPVVLQDMDLSDDDKNFFAAVPQDIEPDGSDIKQKSILAIPQKMEHEGGDIGRKPILVRPQEIESNAGDIRRNSIEKVDPPADIKRNSTPVIPQEMKPNAGDVRRNSIGVIPQELEHSGSGIRRNSMPEVPQKMEPKAGDTSRNLVLWIPHEVEPKGGRWIQSRYLRAPISSCHDYCKYGVRNASEENATAALRKSATERKRISTTSQKPSPDSDTQKLDSSVVTEKKVLSLTKKEIVSAEKVPSSSKDIDVSTEDSAGLKVKRVQSEPSSLPEAALSLRNSKVISTTGPRSVPPSQTRKLNNYVVTEKIVSSSTKETSSKKVSSPKEIAVCMEELIDSKMKDKQLDQSSLPGSDPSLRNSEVTSTINPNPSPDSESQNSTATEKRVSPPYKDIDVSAEDSTDSTNPSPDSEAQELNHSGVTDNRVLLSKRKENVSSKTVLTPIKEIDVSTEGDACSKVKPEQLEPSSRTGQGSSNQGKSGTRKGKEILEGSGSSVNRKIRSKLRRTPVLVERKMLEPETVCLTSKHPVKRVSDANAGSSKNLKGLSHMKDQKCPRKVEPEGTCNKDVPEKILYVVESNTENSTVKPTPNGADAPELSSSSHLSSDVKSSRQARKGVGTTRSPTSSKKKNFKRTVNGGYGRSPTAPPPENKGLRQSTRRPLSSSLSSSSSSSSTSASPAQSTHKRENGATSQRRAMKTGNQRENLKVEKSTRPRKSETHRSESKNSSARKLTFKRGRVLDIKPEISTTRRLKFRRVRLAGEIQNGKGEVCDNHSVGDVLKQLSPGRKVADHSHSNGAFIKRHSPGTKEADGSQSNGGKFKSEKVVLRSFERDVEGSRRKSLRRKTASDSGLNGSTRTEPERVVLRHQDVKGRKDVQKLLNNVIEETASRLVVSRKSKVKALVGAFETVISRQDTKSMASETDTEDAI
ncbi:serine/arginine repetitive matrix protein 2-like [Pyrus ussuriensis x Pyrus communis]|uniref:Serine/arginine repetitive matrix protein 2-like n=1 Tax=Pyrus ussuriensis x Pyrus communis TaxID=2448454 RepID=A0A5N5GWB7_9ROSA|nr:serine/arginine repetitive matrix protein 2-like [Pyrus ussuriensis x Pyrus communis]